MSAQSQPIVDFLVSECVSTEKLARNCLKCGAAITQSEGRGPKRKYCVDCNADRHARRDVSAGVARYRKLEAQRDRRRRLNRGFMVNDGPMESGQTDIVIERVVKDRGQQYSRCKHCGLEFATLQGFAFCGETVLVNGACKRAYMDALPTPSPVMSKFEKGIYRDALTVYPRNQFRSMGHRYLNFCPKCNAYVQQNHEHV
jgi:hypothetical protein